MFNVELKKKCWANTNNSQLKNHGFTIFSSWDPTLKD